MSLFRSLRRTPWYVALVVATMASGLGSVMALGAVVDGPLLRPLPFPAGDRLVLMHSVNLQTGREAAQVEGPIYEAILRHRGLEMVSYVDNSTVTAILDDTTESWPTVEVSPQALSLFGVRPVLGRLLHADDFAPAPETPALIGAGLWMRRFGRDPGILDRVVRCEGKTLRIVGIFPADTLLPAGLFRPLRPDVIVPDRTTEEKARTDGVFAPIARLRPGFTLRDARAELSTQLGPAADRYPQLFTMVGMKMVPLRDALYGGQRRIYLLLSCAALVILTALCLNSANLLLARLRHKGQDVALQRALGARRRLLVAEMFGQNLVLAACALLPALAIASVICHYLREYAPANLAAHLSPQIDLRTAALGAGLAALVAIVMSALAMPQMLRLADGQSLRGTQIGGSRTHAWQTILVAAQTGLVLALVVGAGLMVHSVARLVSLPVGAEVDNVRLFRPRVPHARYSGVQARTFWHQLLAQVKAHPAVASAAAGFSVPMGEPAAPWASLAGRAADSPHWSTLGAMTPVTREYFDTLGIRLTQGRTFTEQEDRTSAAVGVINETAARTYWPDGNPVGRTLQTPWFPHPHTVIGVVADSRYDPQLATVPTMYIPMWTHRPLGLTLLVRSSQSTEVLRAIVLSAMREIEPEALLPPSRTYAELVDRWSERPRFLATLMAVFAALILGVAAMGTAAVVGYGVLLRYRELGIRIALGASRHLIHRLVLRDTLRAASAGIVAGVAAAFFFGRLLQHELYATTPADPLTYVVAIGLLLVTVIGAAYVPARVASRTDPSITLRHE